MASKHQGPEYIIKLSNDNKVELTEDQTTGFIRFQLKGHPFGLQGGANPYIILKFNIEATVSGTYINFIDTGDDTEVFFNILGELENPEIDRPLVFNIQKGKFDARSIKEIKELIQASENGGASHEIDKWELFTLSLYNEQLEEPPSISNAIISIEKVEDANGNISRGGYKKRKKRKRKSRRTRKKKRRRRRKRKSRRTRKKKRRKR
tara:strand:- start:237 stop:857 length:621 start_codon:yes stop_codon:yes gene_type:complete